MQVMRTTLISLRASFDGRWNTLSGCLCFLLSCSLTHIFLFYSICSSCEAASLLCALNQHIFEVGTLSGSQRGGTGVEQRRKDKCFKIKTLRSVHMLLNGYFNPEFLLHRRWFPGRASTPLGAESIMGIYPRGG